MLDKACKLGISRYLDCKSYQPNPESNKVKWPEILTCAVRVTVDVKNASPIEKTEDPLEQVNKEISLQEVTDKAVLRPFLAHLLVTEVFFFLPRHAIDEKTNCPDKHRN